MELKDLIKTFDIPEELSKKLEEGKATEEEVTEFKKNVWVSRKAAAEDKSIIDPAVNEALGKRMNILQQDFVKQFKSLGVDITKEHLEKDGKPVHIEDWTKEAFASITSSIDELKENAEKGNDEKVQKLTQDIEKYKKDAKTYKDSANDFKVKLETSEQEFQNQFKGLKIQTKIEAAKNKVPFKDGITPIEKKGYESLISELKYDLDDNDNVVALTSEGEPIFNEAKTEKLRLDEVLIKIASDSELIKKNAGTQNAKERVIDFKAPENGEPKKSRISPAAREAAAKQHG